MILSQVKSIITLSTCTVFIDLRPTVLGPSFCVLVNSFADQKIDHDAEIRTKNRGPKAHANWTRGQEIMWVNRRHTLFLFCP